MHKMYNYTSCFAQSINSYIFSRRSVGYLFDNPAYWLYRFDQFCDANRISTAYITRKLFIDWASAIPNETKTTQYNRLTALRCFSIYLNSHGVNSYVAHTLPRPEKKVPYLMDDKDILSFFEQVDSYHTCSTIKSFNRLEKEYKIIFRLIFCCGLRSSEACTLKSSNVDLANGKLTIIHSKGDKDRIVYLSEDLNKLCSDYKVWLDTQVSEATEWFFPGKKLNNHIPNTSLNRKFNEFWNATEISKYCDKKPTVHSFRHAFVIKRINLWMSQNIELRVMMPYLSNYLGHSGPMETHYYYHVVKEAFEVIKSKDTFANEVIPEVKEYE